MQTNQNAADLQQHGYKETTAMAMNYNRTQAYQNGAPIPVQGGVTGMVALRLARRLECCLGWPWDRPLTLCCARLREFTLPRERQTTITSQTEVT